MDKLKVEDFDGVELNERTLDDMIRRCSRLAEYEELQDTLFYNNERFYWCREYNVEYVEFNLKDYVRIRDERGHCEQSKAKLEDALTVNVFSRANVMDDIISYISKVEKLYGFKGTLTHAVLEKNIKDRDSAINLLVIRVGDEWHRSPTLYQVFSLLVRMIIISKNSPSEDRFFDIEKFDDGCTDIMAPFSYDRNKHEVSNSPVLYEQLKAVAHLVLDQRDVLYGEDIINEWSSSLVETPYGKMELFSLFTYSGTYSLYNAIHYYMNETDTLELNKVPYFKFVEKEDCIVEAISNINNTDKPLILFKDE